MAPIVVTVPHHLGKEEALKRLKPALGKAAETFPVFKVEEEIWSDNRMNFRVRALGQVVSGHCDVGETGVRLEITLPWLLHKFAATTQKLIAGRGQALLEKK